jgi:hypothetical protein
MQTLQAQQKIQEAGQYAQIVADINKDYYQYWLEHTLCRWDFWLSIAISVIPWIIWFRVRKRESQARLLFAGAVMLIVSSWFDFLGSSFGLWFYTGKIIPTNPAFATWDFCVLPVGTMLFLQFKPAIKAWKKALAFAGISAFIGEPLFQWVGLYVPVKWNGFYSYLIYVMFYILCDKISKAKTFAPLA